MNKNVLMMIMFAVLGTGLIFAQENKGASKEKMHRMEERNMHKKRKMMGERRMEMLDLTEAQKQQISSFNSKYFKQNELLKLEAESAEIEIKKLMLQDNWTEKQLDKLLQNQADKKVALKKNHLLMRRDVQSVLTEEQKQKMASFKHRKPSGPNKERR